MNPQRKYLEAKVLTARPEGLMLMLFDGAIGFSTLAKSKLEERDYAASCELLIRSQKILLELVGVLKPEELGTEIHAKLAGHYWFVHGRLVQANLDHETKWIDEALSILTRIREHWARAIAEGEAQASTPQSSLRQVAEASAAGLVSSINLQV
jgi:flagellar protein FliS